MRNGNKNILFVKANVMNISTKFQLYSPYGFCCPGNQSDSAVWTKFMWLVEDYSRNISVKLLSKRMQ